MTKNSDTLAPQTASPEYQQLVADATARVQTGQLAAFRAVNKELIQLYWDLGKMIAERQQANGWGNSVVELLAGDLQKAFPRMLGLSSNNLWRARAFYLAYFESEILAPLAQEIGWMHNCIIFQKCKDPNECLFYIHQTRRFGWTKNVLIHQIENQTFEKTVIGQQNFAQNLPENLQAQAILAVKDDYAFDFLELGEQHSEHQLEQAILQNISAGCQQTHRRGDLQHFKIAPEGIAGVFPLAGGTHQTGGSGDKIGWRTLKPNSIKPISKAGPTNYF